MANPCKEMVLVFFFFIIVGIIVLPFSVVSASIIVVNSEGKTESEGTISTYLAGTCGQDYSLITPINADIWRVNITIISKLSSQTVLIRIFEVIGDYPYNYEEQTNAPSAQGTGKASLVTYLNTTTNYEVWIRDSYAKNYTGNIEETWFSLDSLSAYDYLMLEPGHFLTFSESHGTSLNFNKKLEMVYQYAKNDRMFITLTRLDTDYHSSALLGGENGDLIALNSGYPSRNEHNYWFVLSLPITFSDGDIWKWGDIGYYVTFFGEKTVNGRVFYDCIKVSIDSTQYGDDYSRGLGDIYFAKDIGIIEWEFRKLDGVTLNLQIQEYGVLPPVSISGRLTLDGRYSATGYYIGLTNYHENDASNTIVDETGQFLISAFGHKVILRPARIAESGWIDTSDHIEYVISDVDGNVSDLIISMGYPSLPDKVEIDDYSVSDTRCDVSSTQVVEIHASWVWDYSDAATIYISIDGTPYLTNSTGWISYTVHSDNLGQKEWQITDVSDCDEYNIIIDKPRIIWDIIEIKIEDAIRQDINSARIPWTGKYLFNNETFQGSLIFNDTLSNKEAGRYGFRVVGISDSTYGLSIFQANDFDLILDRVYLNVSLANNRIDIGTEPEIAVSGIYEYDSQPFLGNIGAIRDFPIDKIGEYLIHIEGINDLLYRLTSFTQNEVSCIWDRVIVELSLSDTRIDVGEEPDISYTAYYEFDSQPFIGDISIAALDSIEEIGDFTYSVELREDSKFGLTTFSVPDTTCIWDRVKIIDGGVSNAETTVKNNEIVWFKAEYEYDLETFDGSKGILYLNDETMEWSSTNQRWEKEYSSDSPDTLTFQITGLRDDTYGLTTFNDVAGPQSIEWKQAGIPGFPIVSIFLGLALGFFILKNRARIAVNQPLDSCVSTFLPS